ncbi:MAG: electron transport complex subunit RsxG [bacterium]|nr:electron transport complex subunit RsxG [bacterium]
MSWLDSENPVVHAGLLGGIALVAAVFLILGNMATEQPIKDRNHEDLVHSLEIVIPDRLHDSDLTAEVIHLEDAAGKLHEIYRARKAGKVTAIAFAQTVNGYMSIHLIMGIDASGEVLGVRVLSHEETPGLGDKIEVAKSDWITRFDGLSLQNTPRTKWGVKKDGGMFDQFSGATITPRAVIKGVREGLEFFSFKRAELLSSDKVTDKDEGGAGS